MARLARRRVFPAFAMAALLLMTGCQRGCLATWLGEHGVVEGKGGQRAKEMPLHGVDCPDGLARCVGGAVEVSRLGQVPYPCTGAARDCSCPWDTIATCAQGCVVDGLVLDAPRARAAPQLCAPGAGELFTRPAPSGAQKLPHVCDEAGHACVASTVVACAPELGADAGARAVAICVRGCAAEGETLDDVVSDAQAAALLCVR